MPGRISPRDAKCFYAGPEPRLSLGIRLGQPALQGLGSNRQLLRRSAPRMGAKQRGRSLPQRTRAYLHRKVCDTPLRVHKYVYADPAATGRRASLRRGVR